MIIATRTVIRRSFVIVNKTKSKIPNNKHNCADNNEETNFLFMASHFDDKLSTSGLIDSGCTSRKAKDTSLLSQIDSSIQSKVVLGHSEAVLAEDKGIVVMHTKQGEHKISNVLYVPKLSQNLLSIAQLLHNNFSLTFKDQVCAIYDPQGAEIARVKMVENAFVLSGDSLYHHAFNAKARESKRWHQCLGQDDNKALKILHSSKMVDNIFKFISIDQIYNSFQEGKMHSLPYLKERLDLVASVLNLVQDGRTRHIKVKILFY